MELSTVNPLEGTIVTLSVERENDVLSSVLFDESQEILAVYVSANKSVSFFLKFMGVIWLIEDGNLYEKAFQAIWGFFVRLCILFFAAYGLAWLKGGVGFSVGLDLDILFGLTMFLQCVTMGLALWDMNRRLRSPVSSIYAAQLSKGLQASYVVLVVSFLVGILPMTSTEAHVLVICEVGLSCVLAAAMYFISTDCSVALHLLEYLLVQVNNECLTFDQYSAARNEIQKGIAGSYWINHSIVFVALLDIAAVLVFAISSSLDLNTWALCMFVVGLFFKEVPFLVVVYWQVAQVNEKSSQLLKQLGTTRWLKHPQSENERLAVYVNAQSKPIVMQLAGMKLKRKDLAWQFALWLFAIVVSIFKAALEKRF